MRVHRTTGDSKALNVKVGLHQGSVLIESPTVCDSNGNATVTYMSIATGLEVSTALFSQLTGPNSTTDRPTDGQL